MNFKLSKKYFKESKIQEVIHYYESEGLSKPNIKTIENILNEDFDDNINFNVDTPNCSCGICDLSGIQDIYYSIKSYIKPYYYKTVLNIILKSIKNNDKKAFVLISNIIDKHQSSLNSILNSICNTHSSVRVNSNTKNKIKIWIY